MNWLDEGDDRAGVVLWGGEEVYEYIRGTRTVNQPPPKCEEETKRGQRGFRLGQEVEASGESLKSFSPGILF